MFRTRRALVYSAVIAAGIATGASAVGSPAAADTLRLTPTSWAYVDSYAPRTSFINPAGDAPIGTRIEADGTSHTYRSYFTFDLTGLRGQATHTALMSAAETAVTDCTSRPMVQLWRTRAVKSNTTWRNPPAELEKVGSYLTGGTRCPSGVSFDLVSTFNAALARGDSSITLELRMLSGPTETQ